MSEEVDQNKKYQKKTQLEHILLRPDTYIGSVERENRILQVLNKQKEIEQKAIEFPPGLQKIFDEILVNAADNAVRVNNMTELKVTIDQEKNLISVQNDGDGIPILIHEKEKIQIPDMIFGHLLTGSNFDDEEKKIVGGRNGYGAKLANIYSKRFTLECVDHVRGLQFSMTWTDNMYKAGEPKITKVNAKKDWVKITFQPDLARFKMQNLDDDIISLFEKRVQDIAGNTSKLIKVQLNNVKVPVNDFKEQVDMYIKGMGGPKVQSVINDRWEVCLSTSPDGSFHQVSFVNSICTSKGGTHVDKVVGQVVEHLQKLVNKEKNFKETKLKANIVKQNLWIFVRCAIENPTFDSQTKENLTLKERNWGSTCEIDEKFLKEISKSGLLDMTLNLLNAKNKNELARMAQTKKGGRITGIKKLDDANQAGKKDADKCTLILTEGDSAKALAVAGLGVIGRDQYGVFPLRGKVMNVREATNDKVKNNEEIMNLLKIMGMVQNKTTTVQDLRYGSIMIMTDQDFDGSHIKGLIINMVHQYFPSLLHSPGFIKEFITPVIKAFKKTNAKESISFYTMPEFDNWYRNQQDVRKKWRLKQYKGLGTSTSAEAKEYFTDLRKHKIEFKQTGPQNDEDIVLAFDKKKADQRKVWLANLDQDNTFIDTSPGFINFSEFIHKELILFSNQTNVRAIPSCVDGLKPGMRKILHTMLKMNQTGEIKVAQLAGKVSEKAAYHHGEVSLQETIVKLAQDQVGSNNINLLMPLGQFGTRLMGGSDNASARQIFTKLSAITKQIFKDEDKQVLKQCEDDGQTVEPEFFVPVIPMVLVNGGQGIGTGWSTFVPNFNPREIIANIRRMLNAQEILPMKPWQRGFHGEINEVNENRQRSLGIAREVEPDVLMIEELPINKWTNDQKVDFLDINLSIKGGHIEEQFDDGDEHRIKIEIHTEQGALDIIKTSRAGQCGWFNLEHDINLTNMVLYNSDKRVYKQDNVHSIFMEFQGVRFKYQTLRRTWMLKKLHLEQLTASNKKRFIQLQLSQELKIHLREMGEVNRELHNLRFTPQKELNRLHDELEANTKSIVNFDEEEDENKDEKAEKAKETENEFAYLMDMPIRSFTNKKVKDLADNLAKIESEIAILEAKDEKIMWLEDIDALEGALTKFEKDQEKAHAASDKKKERKQRKVKKNAVKDKKDIPNTQKDKEGDKKGPRPKRLPGLEEDTQDSDTSKVKVNKDKPNKAKKDPTDSSVEKKDKKAPKAKTKEPAQDPNTETKPKALKPKTRANANRLVDLVDDDSFDMSDVVSEESQEESFKVNKNKRKKGVDSLIDQDTTAKKTNKKNRGVDSLLEQL